MITRTPQNSAEQQGGLRHIGHNLLVLRKAKKLGTIAGFRFFHAQDFATLRIHF